ncbi:hypothetical protein M2650_03775 [Luteimonas sp. SX5]|uniref:Uncharacterized protein n=1 Tax=Luteimonas galliterrae TaxID=2940486 RepID=A0ABT0MFV9_9GAMM|nr:hypothetical protein [Luteimonas galliterrae]MCL1633764.1 hypothetical protein [Luteimonas galliterrae]
MNRKLHNTFSALSVATVLMTAGLIVATPAPQTEPTARLQSTALAAVVEAATVAESRQAERIRAAEARAKAVERAAQVQAKNIELRAQALAKELQGGKQDVGEILGRVAGFTAEVATEAAFNAALQEFASAGTAEAAQATETYDAPPAPVRKPRQHRRSLAMPYFSFANRG